MKGFVAAENELDASVEERFGELGLQLSRGQKRRVVEFLKSSEDQYRSGTVMFADITGYTTLNQELKPEYVHEIVRAYYGIFSTTVELYNGFVVEFAGDGALAVFGAPMAFERDAESAVLAAMDIRQRVRLLPEYQGRKIRISVGIATGEILSAIVREKFPPHYKIVGQAVNLAARVQSSAESDTIVIDDETMALVGDRFQLEKRERRSFKNVQHAVDTYQVLEAHLEKAVRHHGSAVFIGRRGELNALLEKWKAWEEGGGGFAVCVHGEAGIGKTRFVREFADRLGGGLRVARGESSLFQQKVPYGVMRSALLELVADDATGGAGASIAERAETWLRARGFDGSEADPLKLIFGLKDAITGPLSSLPAPTVFKLVCADLKRLLEVVGKESGGKLLLILDDLQWSDRTSLEVLSWFLEHGAPQGVFMVLCRRSDFVPPTQGLLGIPSIALPPLEKEERAAVFNLLADGRSIAPELRDRILQQAEGNPLFLIEFFAALGRGMAQSRTDGLTQGGDWIPPSLRQLIQARIDALEDQRKSVLQAASVVGRRFAAGLLEVFSHIKEDLLARLYALKSAEFLNDDSIGAELFFYFTQNLAREVAYTSLLERRRREFHHTIAEYLEEKLQDGDEDLLPILAYHYRHAQHDAKAAQYLEMAGDRAKTIGAISDARDDYEAAAAILAGMKPTVDVKTSRYRVLRSLGILHRYAGEMEQAKQRNQDALEISASLRNKALELEIRHQDALIDINSNRAREAEATVKKLLREARRLKLEELETKLLNVLGIACWSRGDFKKAKASYLRCLARIKSGGSIHTRSDIINNLGLIAWKQNDLETASRLQAKCIALRRKSGNRLGMASALMNAGIVREQQGRDAQARRLYLEAINLARGLRLMQIEGAALANLANMALSKDDFQEAAVLSGQSLQLAMKCSDARSEAISRENLAQACIGLREFAAAREEVELATKLSGSLGDHERELTLRILDSELRLRTGDHSLEEQVFANMQRDLKSHRLGAEIPRVMRLCGEMLVMAGHREEARRKLTSALREARKQSSRPEERRISALLARLDDGNLR
ncbi:AAA family ATPase [Candidatus Sumerlaeota bacterium]|nr:AAA family ATPase [Candidatus Sumerlaeota bacterium]